MIRELCFGDVNHVQGPLLKTVPNLHRAVTNRAPHLPGKLGSKLDGAFNKQGHSSPADRSTLGDRDQLPLLLRFFCSCQCGFNFLVRCQRTFYIDGAIDRADCPDSREIAGGVLRHDHSGVTYAAAMPPSTRNSVPVTKEDSSDARNNAARAISTASPKRPMGIWISLRCRFGSVSGTSSAARFEADPDTMRLTGCFLSHG